MTAAASPVTVRDATGRVLRVEEPYSPAERAAIVAGKRPVPDGNHGTGWAYVTCRCRCEECDAWRRGNIQRAVDARRAGRAQ